MRVVLFQLSFDVKFKPIQVYTAENKFKIVKMSEQLLFRVKVLFGLWTFTPLRKSFFQLRKLSSQGKRYRRENSVTSVATSCSEILAQHATIPFRGSHILATLITGRMQGIVG